MSIAMRLSGQRVEKNGYSPRLSIPASNVSALTFKGFTLIVEAVEVTPEIAAEWLKRNSKNRPIKQGTLARYTAIMKNRKWVMNGDTIVFDRNGDLLNGQHRLTSCVESGESFDTLVVRGGIGRDEAFPTYDQGATRTASDALAIEGHTNTKVHAAVLAHLWRHERGKHNHTSECPEKYETIDLDKKYQGVAESVSFSVAFAKIVSPTFVAFAHQLFTPQDPDRAAQFFDGLLTGANLRPDSPVLHLRNRLCGNRSAKAKLKTSEIIALFFKAWVAFRDRRPMKALRWINTGPTPESFPSID